MIAELHNWVDGAKAAFASGLMHGTLLAVITGVLCLTLLRRARPTLIATLWTIVLIKFVLPVGPGMPVSVNSLVDATVATETFHSGLAPITSLVDVRAPVASIDPTPGITAWFVVQLLLLAAYIGIVMLLLARRLRDHARLVHRLRALDDAGDPVVSQVTRLARRLRVRRPPRVKLAGANTSPFVVGVWRPMLVVPRGLAGDELEAVVCHELAHLRRFDAVVRTLQIVVGAVFFFWPVVGWVSRRLDGAREMACDQWAVAQSQVDRRRYARMLVNFARAAQPRRGFAMPMAGSHLESRVDALLRRGSAPRLGVLMGFAVAAWALVSLGGSASAQTGPSEHGECLIKLSLADKIIQNFPEADTDGDGVISRDEFCTWLQPIADTDRDGRISASEMEVLRAAEPTDPRARIFASVADPIEISGQMCETCICEPRVQACMAPDPTTLMSLNPKYQQQGEQSGE